MPLSRMEESGAVHSVKNLPPLDVYQRYLTQAPQPLQAATQNYIASVIQGKNKFSLATAFSKPWPSELDNIWDFIQDEKLSAFILSYIVMNLLIADNDNWMCTKTNIQDREFDANFYWRAG